MIMTQEIINENQLWKTADLALATAISLFYPIEVIEKTPSSNKGFFLFKRSEELDALIENYWRGELKIEPQAYFNQLKIIKVRLYSQE